MDIVDRIDQVLGCAHCGGDLNDSPSIDFCCETCQDRWHAGRADPMPAAAGPDHLPGSLGATLADMSEGIAQLREAVFRRIADDDPAMQEFLASTPARLTRSAPSREPQPDYQHRQDQWAATWGAAIRVALASDTAWDSVYHLLWDANPGADPDDLEFFAHRVCQADISLQEAQRILRWRRWVGPDPETPGDMI